MFLDFISQSSNFVEWIEAIKLFGIRLVDVGDFTELLFRFILNTVVLIVILRYVNSHSCYRRDFYFSYMSVATVVFLLCFILNSVKLELGFALGLFAIFGIIRYRTDAIPIKEMTYLFVVIGVSVINALANKKVSYVELLAINSIVMVGLWFLERYLELKQEGSLRIVYENIANVHRDRHEQLMADLVKRTGVEIKRFEIQKIDYLRDIAIIVVYFNAGSNGFSQDTVDRTRDYIDD